MPRKRKQNWPIMSALATLSFSIFPVYWLPWLSSAGLVASKIILLIALTLSSAISTVSKGQRVRRVIVYASLALVILALLNSIIHNDLQALSYLPAIPLFLMGLASPFDLKRIVYVSALIFTIFPTLVIVDFIAGGVWANPIHPAMTVSQTGFHGGRTGWSFAVNMLAAILIIRAVHRPTLASLVALALCCASILVVGSRGGLLTITVLMAYFALMAAKGGFLRVVLVGVSFLAAAATVLMMFPEIILSSRGLQVFYITQYAQSEISNGRVEINALAWALFAEAPLLGHGALDMNGFGDFKSDRIHNVWLRTLAEQGIVFTSAYAYFVYLAFRNLPIPLLLAALIPTLFEPGAISGNYFTSAIVWILAGHFAKSSTVNEQRTAPR